MAKIIRLHQFGDPDVLRVESGEVPAPGEGEVKIAVEAIGMNRLEATTRSGQTPVKPLLPALLGNEAVGRIVALGAGTRDWAIGDLVATLPAPAGYGVYASEVLYPAANLIRLTDDLDAANWAASWIAFLTAWGGLVEAGGLQAGQTVVVTAASSAVGVAAMQIARDLGADVLGTTRTSEKVEALAPFGPRQVIATDSCDPPSEIRRLTDGRGADLVFDAIAGRFAEGLMAGLAEWGAMVIYGGLSREATAFPRPLAMGRNLRMSGFSLAPMLQRPGLGARVVELLRPKFLDGTYRMPIAHRFSMEDMAEAHRAVERNSHIGKVVVTV